MSTTQPIRDLQKLEQLKNYFRTEYPNLRNYMLIEMGVNTAFRISDMLALRWKDVYNFYQDSFHSHIILIETKTKKKKKVALNSAVLEALQEYKDTLEMIDPYDYLFYGKTKDAPLSRSQAFRILKNASKELHFLEPISCHSLRKTFGYHAWKSGVPPIIIMNIFNHSSFQVTKRYLGIEQDDIDSVFLNVQL